MGRRLERWRWRQLALLTSSRGVCGRLRTPANLAGGVRDAGQESRVHVARNEYAHQTGSRPEWTDAGYDHSPHTGACEGGVFDTPLPCRPAASAGIKKPDTCREFLHTYPAFLAGVPDASGQLGRPLRPLGNLQRRVLTLPMPRKPSAARFGAFRPLGNVQRRVLMLSDASETFSGAF